MPYAPINTQSNQQPQPSQTPATYDDVLKQVSDFYGVEPEAVRQAAIDMGDIGTADELLTAAYNVKTKKTKITSRADALADAAATYKVNPKDVERLAIDIGDGSFSDYYQAAFELKHGSHKYDSGEGESVLQDVGAGFVAGVPRLASAIVGAPALVSDVVSLGANKAANLLGVSPPSSTTKDNFIIAGSRALSDKLSSAADETGRYLHTDAYNAKQDAENARTDSGTIGGLFSALGSLDADAISREAAGNWKDIKDAAAFYGNNPLHGFSVGAESAATMALPIGVAGIAAKNGLNATRAAIVANSEVAGTSSASDTRDKIMEMSFDDLSLTSPVFNDLLSRGFTPEHAKDILIKEAGGLAGAVSGALSGIASKVTGAGKFEASAATGGNGKGIIKGFTNGIVTETPQEAIESGGGQFATNLGVQQYANESQDLGQGVLKATTQGAILGGALGGVVGAASPVIAAVTSKKELDKAKLAAEIDTIRNQKIEKTQQALAIPTVGAASAAVDEGLKAQTAQVIAGNDKDIQDALAKFQTGQVEEAAQQPMAIEMQDANTGEVLGRVQDKPIDIDAMIQAATESQRLAQIEAAYRQRDAAAESKKQADLIELEIASLDKQRESLLKLQGAVPVTNTAMAAQLQKALDDNELKRLVQLENRNRVMETNPLLVEAGAQDMQGVETPELPMPITEQLQQQEQVTLPDNFADERLADNNYRSVLASVAADSTAGGNISLVPKQGTGYIGGDGKIHNQELTRTKSTNPPITQALVSQGYKVEEIKAALDNALSGKPLGKRYAGLVTKALDMAKDDAADITQQNSDYQDRLDADIAPQALGYGDAVNAPFAPDNAIPATLADQAKERGAEGGVKYSFAGQKAKTANLENLATAEQMLADGVDADTVWKQTGWEKGVDGKWRFEIDDSKVKAKGYAKGTPFETVWEGKYKQKGDTVTVSDFIDHDELFAAYPALSDVSVTPQYAGDTKGGYDPSTNSISINKNLTADEVVSVLMHEIQHAIQKEENFARGGSQSMFNDYAGEARREKLYVSSALKVKSMVSDGKNQARSITSIAKQDNIDKDMLARYVKSFTEKELAKKLESALNDINEHSAFGKYQRLTGEAEARNTQARLTLGAEARRNTPPRMTEDVARDKQIVRFDGGRAEMAVDSGEFSFLDKTDAKTYRKAIEKIAQERYAGKPPVSVKTKDGEEVVINWQGVKHNLNNGQRTWENALVSLHLEELLSNASLVDVEPNRYGKTEPKEARKYESFIDIDGSRYTAKVTARTHNDGKRYYEHLLVNEGQAALTESVYAPTQPKQDPYANITTPKSEVNTLKQELAKSKDAQRLMNSGKVEVVQSERDLPADIEGMITKSDANGQVQGLFDPAANKTYLIADNLSTADAMGVLTHEVGIHAWFNSANSDKKAVLEKRAVTLLKSRGMAASGLREFLDSVQQRLIDAGHVDDNGNIVDGEEAVAYIVEQAINQFADSRYLLGDSKLIDAIGKKSKALANFIADFIAAVRSSMHRIGWLGTSKLTAGDLVAIAKGNVREIVRKDVGVNDSVLAGDMANDGAAKYSQSANTTPVDAIPAFGLKEKWIANEQDRMIRVKQIQKVLNEKVSGVVPDLLGAVNRYFAIAPSRVLDMSREVNKAIAAMSKDDITPDVMGTYMYAKHAPERNEHLYFNKDAVIRLLMSNGLERGEAVNLISKHGIDYWRSDFEDAVKSGQFKPIVDGSGMSDKEAIDIAADLLKTYPSIEKHSRAWRKIIDDNLTLMEENGTVSKEAAAQWRSEYPNYVPLQNQIQDDEEFETVTGIKPIDGFMGKGTGQRFNLTGKEIKKANGRITMAGDILENAVFNMQRHIIRAEKNNVHAMLVSAAAKYKNDNLWSLAGDKFKRDENGKVMRDADNNPMMRNDKAIEGFINGKKYYVFIKDSNLYEALAGLTQDQFTFADHAVQFIKKTITAWNPAFTIINALRDTLSAVANGSQELGYSGAAKMAWYMPRAMAASWRYERDKSNPNRKEWDKWHLRYRLAGGKTGFLDARSLDKIQNDINKQFRINQKLSIDNFAIKSLDAAASVLRFVEDIGGTSENMWRLAAFRVAIEQGKPVGEAARIAKNLTVNFDTKGKEVRSREKVFLFYNAAMQGTVRMGQALTSAKVWGIVGLLIAAGFLAGSQGDEDEEGNNLFDLIPESEKMKSIPIIIDGKRVDIPMAYGFGFFTYFGMKLAQLSRHANSDGLNGVDVEKALSDLIGAAGLHFIPFGGMQFTDSVKGDSDQLSQLLSPVLLDPVIQVAMNKSGFGKSLYPENPYDKEDTPDSEKVFEFQRGNLFDKTAKFISASTGGDGIKDGAIEVTPATIETVTRLLTGGAGRFVEGVITSSMKAVNGDPLEARDIPVASVVVKSGNDKLYYDAWREVVKDVEHTESMMKRYDNKGDVPSDVENDYRLRLAGEVKASTKLDKAYRDEIAELTKEIKTEPSADKKEAMRLEVERLKAEQNKEKARLVMEYKKEAANK